MNVLRYTTNTESYIKGPLIKLKAQNATGVKSEYILICTQAFNSNAISNESGKGISNKSRINKGV